MKQFLEVSSGSRYIVSTLQEAGYEAYVVGGAVRDLLLGRTPKDFDIACSATPEEVRKVFGRRSCRIIGKRFRLSHVMEQGELYEVSTFRQAPVAGGQGERKLRNSAELPENLIVSDNAYGTSEEDAWRRDFTVNALFYNPTTQEILDYTGQGLADIEKHIVRAIGEPALRFEEDPVRMLRALKLVAQFDFELESSTENALFASLPLFRCASESRLSLELEKILKSTYGDRHLEVFHDYGLLAYFLPEVEAEWGTLVTKRMLDLLYERNARVDERRYRDSISLALAALALPFVEQALGREPGTLWERGGAASDAIHEVLMRICCPQALMVRLRESAERILQMQPLFEDPEKRRLTEMLPQRSYPHARELKLIRSAVQGADTALIEAQWPFCGEKKRKKHR